MPFKAKGSSNYASPCSKYSSEVCDVEAVVSVIDAVIRVGRRLSDDASSYCSHSCSDTDRGVRRGVVRRQRHAVRRHDHLG